MNKWSTILICDVCFLLRYQLIEEAQSQSHAYIRFGLLLVVEKFSFFQKVFKMAAFFQWAILHVMRTQTRELGFYQYSALLEFASRSKF